jgi:3-oxoadipate enol-lactonase
MTKTWVHAGARRLYCYETGEGPAVVLLHGMTNAGIAWRSQVAALVNAGYRVIVPDMVSHGASDPATGPVTVRDLAEDVRSILDFYSVERADVVGVSMGGTTALALGVDAPNRIRRLVVVNAGPSTDIPEFKAMLSKWSDKLRSEDGPLELLDELWPFSVNNAYSESDAGRETYQLWRAVTARVDGDAMANVLEGVVSFNISDRLASITAETLFIGGGEDPSSAMMRTLPDAMPNARYEELPQARHIANVDEAAAFNGRLLSFLR